MKQKLLALLLITGLLTGCGTTQVPDQEELPEEAAPVTQAQQQELRYQVTLKPFEKQAYAEDGQLLASYHVQVPVMQVLREDGTPLEEATTGLEEEALAAAETFRQKFIMWTEEETFQELVDAARTDMEAREESGYFPGEGYALELSCTVYQTERLVSIAGLCYSNTGGVHPNTWQLGWNFDLENGTFFDGETVSSDSAAFRDAVSEELLRQAEAVAAENGFETKEMFWEDYETILRDWGHYTVYFDSNGMNVVFSPYELAPYAAGAQEFHLPYEWLQPLLGERGCQILGLECGQTE